MVLGAAVACALPGVGSESYPGPEQLGEAKGDSAGQAQQRTVAECPEHKDAPAFLGARVQGNGKGQQIEPHAENAHRRRRSQRSARLQKAKEKPALENRDGKSEQV